MRTAIVGGYVVDPMTAKEGLFDVIVVDDKVAKVIPHEARLWSNDIEIIDAKGKVVTPGFIDLHVHLREPGYTHKETIATGTKACAKGGFTTVACMPNTNPVIDHLETLTYLKKRIDETACIDVIPIVAITKGLEGKELAPHDQLFKQGIFAISDDGRTTMDDGLMEAAFINAKCEEKLIITHCEDHTLSEKDLSVVYPIEAETRMVSRDLLLCEATKGRLHVAHVSGEEAIHLIGQAKRRGVQVSCEVTPHHLALNDSLVDVTTPNAKVNPPIRSESHRKAVIRGIKEGIIDIIATDHAPHDGMSKTGSYEACAYGISGAETAFSVAYSTLVLHEQIGLMKLIEMMTSKPAEIGKFQYIGSIQPGYYANLTILDLNVKYQIDQNEFISKGKNTPFHGKAVQGIVERTIFHGKTVYERKV